MLLAGSLYLILAMGDYIEKMAKWLSGFQAIIGIIAIVVGVVIEADLLLRVVLIVVGFIIAASIDTALPAIGK